MVDIEAPGVLPLRQDTPQRLQIVREARKRRVGHVLQQALGKRAEAGRGNAATGERRAGSGVDNGQARATEIARFLSSGGHGHETGIALVQPVPLKRHEEERAVLAVVKLRQDHRTAQGETEIVLLIHGDRRVVSAARVEEIVAQDLKRIAVQLVGSRSCLVSHNPLSQTVLGRERRAQHIELVHLLERRIPDRLETLRLGLRHRDPVEHDFVFEVDATVDPLAEGPAGHTRSEEHELIDLAATATGNLVGQFLNHAILDGRVQIRLGSVQGNHVRADFHSLGDVAGLEHRVHRRCPADLDADTGQNDRLEPGQLHSDRIGSRNQVRHHVCTSAAGGRRLGDAGSDICDGHFRIRRKSA
jgi:hypothetical protein